MLRLTPHGGKLSGKWKWPISILLASQLINQVLHQSQQSPTKMLRSGPLGFIEAGSTLSILARTRLKTRNRDVDVFDGAPEF